MSEDQLNIL